MTKQWLVCALVTTAACAYNSVDSGDELAAVESDSKILPQLTVVHAGTGGGDVASADGAVACGTRCAASYKTNTTVTLTASPRWDSRFVGWEGAGCSGTGACTFRIKADVTVKAEFELLPVLRVDKTGTGKGSVFVPPDLGCSEAALWCSQIRSYGETVTLTATPATGSTFTGWSGACAGASPTCTLTLTADTEVSAAFDAVQVANAYVCSQVSSMVTDTGGGVYTNWIGAWSGVTAGVSGDELGILLPYDEPNTPTVETQYYYPGSTAASPSVLAIGPNNGGDVPAQILTLQTDVGPLTVYLPAMTPNDCVRTRFYVASDGSTYHSRADHDYTYSDARANIFTESCFGHGVVGPDLTPTEAMVPQHLARAAQ